jgi:hypothetical protein
MRRPSALLSSSVLATLTACLLATSLVACHRPPPERLTADPAPAPVPQIPPMPQNRWDWPPAAAFMRRELDARADAAPIRVVVRAGKFRIHAIARQPDGTYELWDEDDGHYEGKGWRLEGGTLPDDPGHVELTFEKERRSLTLTGELSAATRVSPSALADWSYVATLLGDEPLYDVPAPDLDGPESRRDYVDPAPRTIAAALAHGDTQGALATFRAYQPVGHCSYDGHPAAIAVQYSDLCYSMGRLDCFLKLRVRIMGDQFPSVARSSFGEATHSTHAERLLDTGVDVDRFLLGLVVDFAGITRSEGLGGHRLARSIRDSGRQGTMLSPLQSMATDATLDDYNRFRAVATLRAMKAPLPEMHRLAPSSAAYLEHAR